LTGWNKRKGHSPVRTNVPTGGIVIAVLTAAILTAVLAKAAGARPLRFLHIRHNLSWTSDRFSAHPGLAVTADGSTVVAVWTERYSSLDNFDGRVYLRAASETGGGWGNKITVFPDGSAAGLVKADDVAAVAVAGNTVHVVYRIVGFEGKEPVRTEIRYRTCSLTSGQCAGFQSVVTEINVDAYFVGRADIALDDEGDPHVVWARYEDLPKTETEPAKSKREIWYNTPQGGSWTPGYITKVDDSAPWVEGVDPPIERAPAIACEGGYAHVVWEDLSGDAHVVRYRRRNDASGMWDDIEDIMTPDADQPAGNPDVVAGAGQVFVVLDWCSFSGCQAYTPLYRRSAVTDTVNFGSLLEVGTDKLYSAIGIEYYSSDPREGEYEYLWDLQPSITLNDDGWPAVAWHAQRVGSPGEYEIHYSYAVAGTITQVHWITPTTLSFGQGDLLGSSAIGVGRSPVGVSARELASDDEQHQHIVYMRKLSESAWDIYYDGDEWEEYPHVFMPVIMRNAVGFSRNNLKDR
jgi:hypothetical protein